MPAGVAGLSLLRDPGVHKNAVRWNHKAYVSYSSRTALSFRALISETKKAAGTAVFGGRLEDYCFKRAWRSSIRRTRS